MSWMQLLAVSKSIGSVPDRPSPYKMRHKNLLPRFGRVSGREEPSGVVVGPAAEPELGLFKAQPTGPVSPAEERPAPGGVSAEGGELPVRRRDGDRGWWFWRRRSRRVRRGSGAPFQPELGLEGVRVVRNDLVEDDLMVVPRHRREEPVEAGWRGWFARWWGGWRG